MQVSKQSAALAASLLIGLGVFLGAKFFPQTSQSETKTVVKDRIVTVTRTVKDPNGTVVVDERREEQQDRQQNIGGASKKNDWALGANYRLGSLVPVYGVSVHRRVLGDLYTGGSINSAGELTVGLLFTF